MSTIRTTILSVVLVLVVAVALYFVVIPMPARAAQPAASSPVSMATTSSLSTQELWNILNGRAERRGNMTSTSSPSTQLVWKILNGRYERRVNLPY